MDNVHYSSNPNCPRNNERNQTICTCNSWRSERGAAVDNYGMGLVTSPPDPRERTPHQSRIDDFMCKAGQEVPASPTIPDEEVRRLRAKLIFEEAVKELIMLGLGMNVKFPAYPGFIIGPDIRVEFIQVREPDLKEVADGCADTSVVTIGTLSACGIADARLLEEVDRSNLSKFTVPTCPNHSNLPMDFDVYGLYTCQVPRCQYSEKGPYRSAEGKWQKGPQYSPADIAGVLEKQMPPKSKEKALCGICGKSCMGDLEVCYDHAKLGSDDEPRNPTVAETVAAYQKEHNLMKPFRPGDWQNLDPPPKQRAADDGPRYDSGGITLCPHCKCPLSDELVRKLRKGILTVASCPQCQGAYDLKQLEAANAQ